MACWSLSIVLVFSVLGSFVTTKAIDHVGLQALLLIYVLWSTLLITYTAEQGHRGIRWLLNRSEIGSLVGISLILLTDTRVSPLFTHATNAISLVVFVTVVLTCYLILYEWSLD